MSSHPVVRSILDAQKAAGMPAFADTQPLQMRAFMAAMAEKAPPRPLAEVGSVEDIGMAGGDGPVTVRRYRPRGAKPTSRIVYFHGGGWVVGDLRTSDPICRMLVSLAGCEILSVDYRLAPEHPFPAGLEDGWAALAAAAKLDDLPLFVGGDSAGGNIAAVLALRARDAGGPPIAGQILFYPVTDHDFDRPSYRAHGDGGHLLSTADMEWFWSHYIADASRRTAPEASPLRADDHRGLPPAFVAVAGFDPLHDEGVAYAEALKAAGVPVVLDDQPDMIHGYCAFVGLVDVADRSVADAAQWLRARATESVAA